MNDDNFKYTINDLVKRYPKLKVCSNDIKSAFDELVKCFSSNHKLLIAGNGGSSSDANHISGELLKSFKKKRQIDSSLSQKLIQIDPEKGKELSDKLQGGLPCIVLDNHQCLNTAYINDVENGGLLTYAQQLNVFGNPGDVFLGISTSGNSKNIYYASIVAKAKGMKIIGLTGKSGGKLATIADICIKVPAKETFIVQEYHLPIYHCLCLMLEDKFF